MIGHHGRPTSGQLYMVSPSDRHEECKQRTDMTLCFLKYFRNIYIEDELKEKHIFECFCTIETQY